MSHLARLRRLPFPPGATLYVLLMGVAFFGAATNLYDVYQYLGLHPPSVWRGEVWRLFTYPILALSPIDFILGIWTILWLGAWLEHKWTAKELWLYAGIATACAGLVSCLLHPRFDGLLGGTTVVVACLLVAWARISGHVRVSPAPGWEVSIRAYALSWGVVTLLIAWFSCGRWFALPLLAASAAAGWAYLSLRWRWLERAAHRPVDTRRVRHLEL